MQERPKKFSYICISYRKIALHIAKVFFTNPTENLDNFHTKHGSVAYISPVSMIMWTGGPLATMYFISSGCGVRSFLSCCVRAERSVEVTKTAPHICCLLPNQTAEPVADPFQGHAAPLTFRRRLPSLASLTPSSRPLMRPSPLRGSDGLCA